MIKQSFRLKLSAALLSAAASVFIFSYSSFAVDPITPDNETAKISTSEDVYVVGAQDSFSKSEKHSVDYTSPDILDITVENGEGNVAATYSSSLQSAIITYTNEINAIDGDTHVVENFDYDLSSDNVTPNLKTSSHITFTGASLTKTEKAQAGIKEIKGAAAFAQGQETLCVNTKGACWNAAVGSHIDVSQVDSVIQTDLDITHTPYVHQNIAANGVGLAESGMAVTLKEGETRVYAVGSCPSPSVSTQMQFDSHTKAKGIFEFSKDMKNVIHNATGNTATNNIDKVP